MRGRIVVAFVAGLLFALGLCLSGMTQPQNIIAFLDVRHWNPVLAFVLVGSISVYAIAYRLIVRRKKPLLAEAFEAPARREITVELVAGAAIFGIGWGLAGFCGAPAIASLVAGRPQVFLFVGTMFLGMLLAEKSLPAIAALNAGRMKSGAPVAKPVEPR
jgi:uncharacterized protein